MRITHSLATASLLFGAMGNAAPAALAQSQPQEQLASAPYIVVVRATEYRFEVQPSVPAGTLEFRFENRGKEIHHLWLVRLEHGRTFNDFLKTMDAPNPPTLPSWAVDVGGLNDLSPGMTASATLTLEPGDYAIACYTPAPDGRSHATHGMFKELVVTRSGVAGVSDVSRAAEPSADVTLKLTDYAFDLSKPIESGENIIRVQNDGQQSHEVILGVLPPDKSMSDALEWFNGGQHGPAPLLAIGGASGLAAGRHEFITLDFAPGRYVMFCFIPDTKDGKTHAAHGMMKEFSVGPVAASQ